MKKVAYEKGFTLIELLVTIGILGAIAGVMAMTVGMFLKVGPESNDRAIALRQVQNAGYWIIRDVTGAGTVVVDDDPTTPEFITLNIPVSTTDNKTVVYDLENMMDDYKKLLRTDHDSGKQILIAEYLYCDPSGDPDNTKVIDYSSPLLKIQITAESGNARVKRKYEVTQRVPSS